MADSRCRRPWPLLAVTTALVLATAWAPSVDAHRLRAALTTVLFNDRSNRLEVMHRFYLHDAEHVARRLGEGRADLIDDVEVRQRFAVYVHERFALAGNGEAIPLTLRGSELDGEFLWVYQAAPLPEVPVTGLTVTHEALLDLWPDQQNLVNVEGRGPVRSLTFQQGASTLSVDLTSGPRAGAPPPSAAGAVP